MHCERDVIDVACETRHLTSPRETNRKHTVSTVLQTFNTNISTYEYMFLHRVTDCLTDSVTNMMSRSMMCDLITVILKLNIVILSHQSLLDVFLSVIGL